MLNIHKCINAFTLFTACYSTSNSHNLCGFGYAYFKTFDLLINTTRSYVMNRVSVFFGLVFLLTTTNLYAQGEMAVGVSLGSANIEIDDSGVSFDSNDFGWKIFGVYMFNDNWGIEGGYIDFGNPDDSINIAGFGSVNVEVDANGFELFGVGSIPVASNADVFAKAGVIFWDADISANVAGTGADDSDDGTDLALGVGGRWNVTDQFSLRGEWEWFDIDEADSVWMLSVGVEFRFQ